MQPSKSLLFGYLAVLAISLSGSTYKDQATRICLYGSAKAPVFFLYAFRKRLARGGSVRRLSLAVANWWRFLAGTDEQGRLIEIQAPLAVELRQQANAPDRGERPFLSLREIFGDDLPRSQEFVEQVGDVAQSVHDLGSKATLAKYI